MRPRGFPGNDQAFVLLLEARVLCSRSDIGEGGAARDVRHLAGKKRSASFSFLWESQFGRARRAYSFSKIASSQGYLKAAIITTGGEKGHMPGARHYVGWSMFRS